MKNYRTVANNGIKWIFLIVFIALCGTQVFGNFLWFKIRNPYNDVARLLDRRLDEEERALVDITMAFYAIKFGYTRDGTPLKDAHKKMRDEEYSNAVSQAAKLCG